MRAVCLFPASKHAAKGLPRHVEASTRRISSYQPYRTLHAAARRSPNLHKNMDAIAKQSALASPKLVKNAKGAVVPSSQMAHIAYGCGALPSNFLVALADMRQNTCAP